MVADSTSKKQDQEENEKGLGLQVLTDKQIEAYNIPKELLWYISVKGESVGPFHRDDLRSFLEEHPSFPRDSKVANLVEQKWLPLFKIPEFQRRRPQLVPRAELLENNEFHILKSGQKVGPFKLEYLSENLDKKDILFNDLISIDQGESWIKVHEHPLFDRRNREKGLTSLPQRPNEAIFSNSQQEVMEEMIKKLEAKGDEEGLIGLAYFGKQKSKSSTPSGVVTSSNQKHEEEFNVHKEGSTKEPLKLFSPLHSTKVSKWMILAPTLALLILMGGVYLFKNKKMAERTPATEENDIEQTNIPDNSAPEKVKEKEKEVIRKLPPSVAPKYRPRSNLRPQKPFNSKRNLKLNRNQINPRSNLINDDSYTEEDLLSP